MASEANNIGFQVWGPDKSISAPVELPTLVGWVQAKRIMATTWIFSEKDDRWSKAAEVPELQMFFNHKPASGAASASAAAIPPAALRRVKILAGLSDEALARFLNFMDLQSVRQWTVVVQQGDHADSMYLVLEGELRVRLLIEGKESTLVTLGAGDFFGEVGLFDQGPRSADVVANTDAVLLKISHDAFTKMSAAAPDVAAHFLLGIGRTLASRIRADNKRYSDSVAFARAGQ